MKATRGRSCKNSGGYQKRNYEMETPEHKEKLEVTIAVKNSSTPPPPPAQTIMKVKKVIQQDLPAIGPIRAMKPLQDGWVICQFNIR